MEAAGAVHLCFEDKDGLVPLAGVEELNALVVVARCEIYAFWGPGARTAAPSVWWQALDETARIDFEDDRIPVIADHKPHLRIGAYGCGIGCPW